MSHINKIKYKLLEILWNIEPNQIDLFIYLFINALHWKVGNVNFPGYYLELPGYLMYLVLLKWDGPVSTRHFVLPQISFYRW